MGNIAPTAANLHVTLLAKALLVRIWVRQLQLRPKTAWLPARRLLGAASGGFSVVVQSRVAISKRARVTFGLALTAFGARVYVLVRMVLRAWHPWFELF